MMTVGEINGLGVYLRSIREEWDTAAIRTAINKLVSDGFDQADIAEAAVAIARDRSNRAAVTISIKAPELIARKHAKNVVPRTPGPTRRDDDFLCDVCGLTEDRCLAHAANVGGRDHAFVTVSTAQAQRDAQRVDGRLARARADAIQQVSRDLFKLPADVTGPPDESAA